MPCLPKIGGDTLQCRGRNSWRQRRKSAPEYHNPKTKCSDQPHLHSNEQKDSLLLIEDLQIDASSRTRSISAEPSAPLPWRIGGVYPIIPGKLFFTCTASRFSAKLLSSAQTITSELPKQYFSFCQDFGPNNLAIVLQFCDFLSGRIAAAPPSRTLIFHTSEDTRIRTNAAFLLAAFLVIEHKLSPEQAAAPLQAIRPCPFRGYRDATHVPATFELSILDCLRGLTKGIACGWLAPRLFTLKEYQHWDEPAHGDLHVICPKLLAFKGPVDPAFQVDHPAADSFAHPPELYLQLFARKGVTAVLRLNDPEYDAAVFTRNGIRHYDLVFDDCTVPSRAQLDRFFEIVDSEPGVVAVHCRAGLGRTGTLIGAWLMRHHGFSAREAIAWLRLCRPGSVIGPQQHYLLALEEASQLQHETTPSHCRPGPGLHRRDSEKLTWARPSPDTIVNPPPARTLPVATVTPSSELAEQVTAGMVTRAKSRDTNLKAARPGTTSGAASVSTFKLGPGRGSSSSWTPSRATGSGGNLKSPGCTGIVRAVTASSRVRRACSQ